MKYRNYTILKSDLILDYDFAHNDYDGAEDSGDERIGSADSIEHAKRQIDAIEETIKIENSYLKQIRAQTDNGFEEFFNPK